MQSVSVNALQWQTHVGPPAAMSSRDAEVVATASPGQPSTSQDATMTPASCGTTDAPEMLNSTGCPGNWVTSVRALFGPFTAPVTSILQCQV